MTDRKTHIVITGASSGIGKALAMLLAGDKYLLSLCGRSDEKLEKTKRDLPSDSFYSESFCLSDVQQTSAFFKRAIEKHGSVDVLVNCAGLNNVRKTGLDTELSELAWLMEVNCYAPIRCIQAVAPYMKRHKHGVIINILSTVCLFSNPGIAAYTASKAALDAYTKVMRKELRSDNVKVLSVYPGGVDTNFREAQRPEYLQGEDVAQAIVTLLLTNQFVHIHDLVIRPQSEENFT
ncbi:SDR family oxidoreductase [Alteromonas stellipolaris]|uniref:SDR family oxidoreductase n=1 Tax=Alteromonas stellipolaris TaxID=233316 RepID=UPI0027328E77|nr:SDR family oxidoreductase [Alteromonas stellipolaris]MDP2596904.1 SDR family oxidoreductase [Alteromonas stellipolaris]